MMQAPVVNTTTRWRCSCILGLRCPYCTKRLRLINKPPALVPVVPAAQAPVVVSDVSPVVPVVVQAPPVVVPVAVQAPSTVDTVDSLQKCINGMFSDIHAILADNYDAPVVIPPTPLEIQLADQLKEQARQMEEMKMMMKSFMEAETQRNAEAARKADAARKAEDERKAYAARKAEDERKAYAARDAEAARKAEEEYKAEAWRSACAFLRRNGIPLGSPRAEMDESLKLLVKRQRSAVKVYSTAQHFTEKDALFREIKDIAGQIYKKEKQLEEERKLCEKLREKERKQLEEERKQRELAEHSIRQEEARKRSAAQIQAGKYSIWMKYEDQYRRGNPMELITKNGHVWCSDRTPITVDGKACMGPRLGSYMGISYTPSIYSQSSEISRNCYTDVNGVKYDGTVEPKLY